MAHPEELLWIDAGMSANADAPVLERRRGTP
jgi:hypothetical protein